MSAKYMLALAAVVLAVGQARAQGLRVVERLTGYECMALNLSEAELFDFDKLPPVLSAPRADASRIGVASASVIVASPRRTVGGYVEMLHMDGRSGWVEAGKLRPWVNRNRPSTRCYPAMMSNGRPGFDYASSR